MIIALFALALVEGTAPSAPSVAAILPVARPSIAQVVRTPAALVRASDQRAIPDHLRESVAALSIDEAAWAALASEPHALLESLPLGPCESRSVVLHRVDPFAHAAALVVAGVGPEGRVAERTVAPPPLDCFVGTLLDDDDSRVLLSRGEGFLSGFVVAEGRTWVISGGGPGSEGPLVSYAMDKVPPGTFPVHPWSCEALVAPGAPGAGIPDGGIAFVEPCREARVAVETDAEFLNLFGGNQASAMGYVGTLFAALTDIYSRDVNFRPGMCYLRLWETPTDPWNGTSTSATLYEFRDYWYFGMSMVERDGAMFLSGRGLGGGVAWLNAGCGENAYAVAANLAGSFPYPLVDNSGANWDILVVAHELGHNYGAPHTHNYNPPADGCGLNPQDCSAADTNTGTIMSYCHTCSGGMTNIQLRFHPVNIISIGAYLHSGICPFTPAQQNPLAYPDRVSAIPGTSRDIDVLANDLRFNCQALTLSGVTQPSFGGSAVIVAGVGPEGRDIVRFTPTPSQTGTVPFAYTITDSGGASQIGSIIVDLTPMRLPENPIGDTPQVAVDYFVLASPSVLPDFSSLTPYLATTVPNVNYASTSGNYATSGRADQVGARYTGWVNIPASGSWTFFTNSDDGSRLLIGSTQVVLNDGMHPMQERSGTIELAQGRHAITMEFFENGGGAGMISSWQGPSVTKAAIPPTALTHGGAVNRADINHDGTVNGLDITTLLSNWGTSDPDADINQDGTVSGSDLTLILATWTG
ncbi:MAG: hypothetical protein EXS03_01500 [Phycisphaerales bacterium]|nr:hypothetical protein [Phycisphaerales bacterium]